MLKQISSEPLTDPTQWVWSLKWAGHDHLIKIILFDVSYMVLMVSFCSSGGHRYNKEEKEKAGSWGRDHVKWCCWGHAWQEKEEEDQCRGGGAWGDGGGWCDTGGEEKEEKEKGSRGGWINMFLLTGLQYCTALFLVSFMSWTHGQAFKMSVSYAQEKWSVMFRHTNCFISCHSQSTFLKQFFYVPCSNKWRPFGIREKIRVCHPNFTLNVTCF